MSFYDGNGNLIETESVGVVTPDKTNFWGSDKPYIIGDNYPCEPKEVLPYVAQYTLFPGWCIQLCEKVNDTDNVKVFAVKAGTMYTLLPSSSVRSYFCTAYTTAEPTEEQLASWATNAYNGGKQLAKVLTMTGAVKLVTTQSHSASDVTKFRFTPATDGFVFLPSTADGSMVFEGASIFKNYENFLDKVAAGEITNLNNFLYGYMAYAERYSENAKAKFRVESSDEFMRLLRTGNYWNDLHNSTIKLFVMGDSITWAGSNVGVDKAYRQLLSNKYSIEHYSASQNNTTITANLGDAWQVGTTTYGKGVDGLIEAHLAASKETSESDERYDSMEYSVNEYPIFTIAFGTNDFRYDAPIGTYEDTDSTTFMGGYKKLISRIRELYPNSSIILCTPWKQENWNTENGVGKVLADYNLAIHEIASKTRKCFVLDMFNNPYINESANSRPGTYVDVVHLGKYAHILVAEELEKLILLCVVLNGYPYVKTNLTDNWTGM